MKMKKIIIKNLRNIRNLEFEIPKPGIWVLTGKNGAGKSTLLGALWRIKEPNAFQTYFPSSSLKNLDNHEGASISYIIEKESKEEKVTYKRRSIRWPPTPRRNAHILNNIGFDKVELITVDEKRIFPRKEEFHINNKKQKKAEKFIIDGANITFNTNKFDNLKVLNITRGINPAYLIETINGKFYSEKNFSLGELNVIKLLERLDRAKKIKNVLILIDEFDMALHPIAQKNLIEFLDIYTKEYKHTIIFSTHSASIIKYIEPEKIIHLKDKKGSVAVIKSPSIYEVLEDLSEDIHMTEGPRVFCEDEQAKKFIEVAYTRYTNKKGLKPITFKPLICNSWTHVIDRARETNNEGGRFIAIPDKDIEEIQNYDDEIRGIKNNVKPLPITPEVAIVKYYMEEKEKFIKMIHEEIIKRDIPISMDDLKSCFYKIVITKKVMSKLKNGKNEEKRHLSKNVVKKIIKSIQEINPEIDVENILVGATIGMEYEKRYEEWCQVIGPLHKLLENI